MKKLKTTCHSVCLAASLVLVGCTANKNITSPSLSHNAKHNPRFIDDITLGGNATTVSTTTIESRRRSGQNTVGTSGMQLKYSDMLKVPAKAITNVSLYNFIDEWYGVRYRLGGNDKEGIDCSAFVQRLYQSVFGTDVVRTAFEQFNNCSMVWNTDKLKEGDLVFFRTHGKRITHVGVYLMNNYFVHASSSRGVAISSLNEDYWSRYYAGAGEIPKCRG
ncbi:MAG: glycoside hydrolase [Sphingobacteriales bacterium]|nr:MAG: glycoside hydrolase [Sphingobacteriales bacterium]